jgi:hypothetical protein
VCLRLGPGDLGGPAGPDPPEHLEYDQLARSRVEDEHVEIADLPSIGVLDSARVDWSRGWVVPPPTTSRWFILTSNVLPARPLDDDSIHVRSHRMLERFRWAGPTVADMVAALLSPLEPPGGLGRRERTTMRFGHYDIRIEYLPDV